MIDLVGKVVGTSGWAGPILWVCTTDDYSIHLYDAPIQLDGKELDAGEADVQSLVGRRIAGITHSADRFTVSLDPRAILEVEASEVETARVFKQRDLQSHYVYCNGVYYADKD